MKDNEYSARHNCHVFEYINKKNERGFMHCHEDATEIIFLKSGKLNVWMEQEKFTLNEGDVFVINPCEMHFTEGFCGTHILVSILGCNTISTFYNTPVNILNLISSELQKEKKIYLIIKQAVKFISETKMNKFGQSYIGNDIYDKTIIKLEILKIYSLLLKCFSDIESIKSVYEAETSRTIEDYIKNNLEKNISIKDVAKILNYSESYTAKIVNKRLGGSFKKTVIAHRLDKACDLLYDTDYSIEFISEQCGFNTTRAFYKQFSKTLGMSPTQYRKSKFKTENNKLT